MGLAEVSTILWRERHLLELLAFKLEEQQLLLAAGRSRWVTHAADELDRVLDELRHAELLRAMEVDAVAANLDLLPGPSLSELAAAAPAPWDSLLAQHREALVELSEEVRALSRSNCDLLARGEQAVRELLLTAGAAAGHGALPGDGYRSGALLDRVV